MKMIFMGTPDFAVTILDALRQAGHQIDLVVSQPDRPKGRGKKMQAPPVAEYAKEQQLPLIQPASIRTEEIEDQFKTLNPDVVIVAAYGRIIPDALLAMPKYGYLNVHASILPMYRGAAPIQWALRNGDVKTGVSIMKLESGLDEGAVYECQQLTILPEWNKKDLFDALAVLGANALLHTLDNIDELTPTEQDHSRATYAPMFEKNDAKADFSMAATDIVNLNRSLLPDDSIYSFINNKRIAFKSMKVSDNLVEGIHENGEIMDITKKKIVISTGDGAIDVEEVQLPGKKPMTIQNFLNGHALKKGEIFKES